jgi:mono/diheme cytochrome c family protein
MVSQNYRRIHVKRLTKKTGMSLRFELVGAFALLLLLAACSSLKPPPTAELSPQADRGRELFASYCSTCHSTSEDTIIVGPSMARIATRGGERVDGMDAESYIKNSILEPGAYTVEGFPDDLMPANLKDQLTPEELEAIVVYLLTLE